MKRRGEIVIIAVIAVFWVSAILIEAQKYRHVLKDGECKNQPVLVPVPIDPNCTPNIMLRKCSEANEEYEVNCNG